MEQSVKLRFFAPSDPLTPYLSTLYLTEFRPAPGEVLSDYLHPEWANIRFTSGERLRASFRNEPPVELPQLVAVGPTSVATLFSAGRSRSWGVGLLPLGWAKFVSAPADAFTDRISDGESDPAFQLIAPLKAQLDAIQGAAEEEEAMAINSHFEQLLSEAPDDDPRIIRAHSALVDDAVDSVAVLAERLAMTERSLERFCRKVFGFPPKLLLRRQRFLRSLAQFMIDPSLKWIKTMDWQYHDQAHFTRDFVRFMGIKPREFAALPHPIMMAAAHARMAMIGAAMQALHDPKTSAKKQT